MSQNSNGEPSAFGAVSESLGAAPRTGPMGYGMAPVYAAGVITAFMVPGLAFGSVAMANSISGEEEDETPSVTQTDSPDATEDPDETADPDDPASSPGRDSGRDDDVDETDPDADADEDAGSGTDAADEAEQTEEGIDEDGYYDTDVVHIVEPGETLSSISADYAVPVEVLAEHNEISDVNVIYADSALLIPYSEVRVPADQ